LFEEQELEAWQGRQSMLVVWAWEAALLREDAVLASARSPL